MEVVPLVFLALLGVCVGSFLNVVILRFGFTERASQRSRCAACQSVLAPGDLVPVLSYFWLGGRCRRCGSGLSLQYPLVELSVGFLFCLTFLVHPPALTIASYIVFLATLGFWAALVGLVTYDIKHTLIPMPFVWALGAFAAIVVLAQTVLVGTSVAATSAVAGALVCGGFFALIHFVTQGKGMGIGDAYVASCIGLMLGLADGAVASALGVWLGALVGVAALGVMQVFPNFHLTVAGTRVTLKSEIPFAPFLALGAVIAYVVPLSRILFGA